MIEYLHKIFSTENILKLNSLLREYNNTQINYTNHKLEANTPIPRKNIIEIETDPSIVPTRQ